MANNDDKQRCPFDVLFDIIDEWQEKGKKPSSRQNIKDFQNKRCPSCGAFVTRKQTECSNCGKIL
jgi:RNA polymerase subunit RPABC4/transcription elongation factor Spt4